MTRNLAEKDFGQFDLSLIDVKNTGRLDAISRVCIDKMLYYTLSSH